MHRVTQISGGGTAAKPTRARTHTEGRAQSRHSSAPMKSFAPAASCAFLSVSPFLSAELQESSQMIIVERADGGGAADL